MSKSSPNDVVCRTLSDPLTEWDLTIGEIVAPFGLIGEMKVRLETDFPERFTRLRQICVRWPSGQARLLDVASTRPHKGQILLRLRGIDSINEVEQFRNAFIQVRTRDAVPLSNNEFYIYDLIGCEVVIAPDRAIDEMTIDSLIDPLIDPESRDSRRIVGTIIDSASENKPTRQESMTSPLRNPEAGGGVVPTSAPAETFSASETSSPLRVLGRLTAVLRGGGNDVYVIGSGKDEILLPAVKEVIRNVDMQLRRILVTPTPGLLPGEAEEE